MSTSVVLIIISVYNLYAYLYCLLLITLTKISKY